ncbi:L-ribulose-5-phosphate 4-epimerase UlaF [Clostridia bacterium]|nr:L-ribulose-5-phosphate 4-epimerase UlaF [Clostridia bacterium]
MLEQLKQSVFAANLALVKHGLVLFTWGNVSAIDRDSGLIVIKPSGVAYERMTADDMAVVDTDGKRVEGKLSPSSDTPTHIELYKAFPKIGGVVHTHSTFATAFAQSGRAIACFGTTHADYFRGAIACTRALTKAEMEKDYERNTGLVIAEAFKGGDYAACPAALIKSHAPFVWGKDENEAVHNAVVLEEIAKMAYLTQTLNPKAEPADGHLQDKHYYRKHGANAYYGQK